ncbi:tRNA 2-thiouridine(34) synthase MnmA [Candidatus Nomurabacteria bacterium RIFCSPHIGHO2_01_FULL_40_12]|uniref:tRNA-specific 2-thiouridylase MnmA n=1 Tax=Candidatus Nomurabacteria bacterium RIFCSPHIGHO2_01_FULL_40_12 TaxID=1801737 RepID=A0A1F6UZY7_9BACT|nr:MAG: tRNA 2-thiouridine(34) synthase MnmA [Candidatus Nomurabacteria bacterium RIFCSPHIGHO2_01_FULL_40_12]
MKKKIVFVGLSGGVDSAVSAALLKKTGYEVIGVFIKTWHPDFLECNEEEERRDAMRVAAHLNIPFLTFDLEDVYKKEVADYMITEYRAGRTPNPDVMCNKEVKFGAFLKKSFAMGADYVATGHYAKNEKSAFFQVLGSPGPHTPARPFKKAIFNFLRKGRDLSKDQSYFLWTLTQEQLKKILFPVGHLKKTEVRKLAKKFNLPVAEKKDSQGICFLGAVDLKAFLKHYIKPKRGKVVNEKREVIGHHDGVVFHTLGERHGFTVTVKSPNDKPYYIVGKDIKKNILIVSQDKKVKNFGAFALGDKRGQGTHDAENSSLFYLELASINWISKAPEINKNYTAQIRYHGELLPCKINCQTSGVAQVIFKKPILVASGQSCVIYDKDICLGGGVVK